MHITNRIKQTAGEVMELHNHSTLRRDDGLVHKIIEPNANFSASEANTWASRLIRYYETLKQFSVPVPTHHYVYVKDNRVIQRCSNVGVDLQVLVAQGQMSAPEAAARIFKAIAGLLAQKKPIVGIDPHPANWCFDPHTDGLVYVDFFPLYIVEAGSPLVGYPQPSNPSDLNLNFHRYYTVLGLCRLLRFNFVRLCGHALEQTVMGIIADVLGLSHVLKQLQELPLETVRHDRSKLSKIVSGFSLENVDDIREIAMILPFPDQREFLNRILQLTTVDFRLDRNLREARFEEAKNLVITQAV